MKEILNKFLNLSRNTRVLATIGLGSLFLSIFFVYVKYSVLGIAVKIKLLDYFEGKIMILLILLNLMFIFKDYVKKYLPKLFENNIGKKIENINNQLLTLIPTFLIVVFAFVVKSESKVEFLNISYGLGFYLMWLGVILLVVYAFIYKNERIKLNEPFTNTSTNLSNNQNINTNNHTNQVSAIEPIQAQSTQNMTLVQEQSDSKSCINCGTKCELSAVKCPACGKDF